MLEFRNGPLYGVMAIPFPRKSHFTDFCEALLALVNTPIDGAPPTDFSRWNSRWYVRQAPASLHPPKPEAHTPIARNVRHASSLATMPIRR